MMFISSTSLHRAEQGQIEHLWFVFSQYIERRPHNPAFFGVGHIECVAHVIERAQQSAFDLLDRGFGFPLGEVAQRDQLADNVFLFMIASKFLLFLAFRLPTRCVRSIYIAIGQWRSTRQFARFRYFLDRDGHQVADLAGCGPSGSILERPYFVLSCDRAITA